MKNTYVVCYQRCAGTMLLTHVMDAESPYAIEELINDLAPEGEEPVIHFITRVVKVEREIKKPTGGIFGADR